MATAASALFIESAASTLGAKDVQDGDASPTEALKGAAAMSQAVATGVFGAKLADPSVAAKLQEAAGALKVFGGPRSARQRPRRGATNCFAASGTCCRTRQSARCSRAPWPRSSRRRAPSGAR